MELKVANLDEKIVKVRLTGRLDSPGTEEIELRFTASLVPHGKHTIVDLSDVSIVTSMGLRMLITVAKALAAKKAKMVLYAPQDAVRAAFDSALLGQIIPIRPDEASAVSDVRA